MGLGEILRDGTGAAVDLRLLEVNTSFERQSGLPSSVVGKLITEAAPGLEPFWIKFYARVAKTGEPEHAEYHAAPLGRWFEARAHRTGPDRFATLFLDITARREAEAALAESQARLVRPNADFEARVAERTASLAEAARALEAEMRRREEAQGRLVQAQKLATLGQLVGGVAHDLSNIRAAVQGAFAMPDRRLDDEWLRYVIAEGRKAVDRATSLVRQMLAFARRERLEPQVIEPAERLPGLVSMIHHATGPPGHALRLGRGGEEPEPPGHEDRGHHERTLRPCWPAQRSRTPYRGPGRQPQGRTSPSWWMSSICGRTPRPGLL